MRQRLVVITGGAGFIGGHLCHFLQSLGYYVRLLDSRPFGQSQWRSVDVMQGDVRDPKMLNRAMRGASFVIHAATAPVASNSGDVFATDVFGTWSVLQAAQRAGVARLVYLSSVAVYGDQFHRLMHEDDSLMGYGPYAEARIEAEYLCHSARLAGLCVSTLRLTSVVGPGARGVFASLYRAAAAGRNFPMLTRGDDPCQVLDVEDLCQAVHRCLLAPQDLVNDTFNLGGLARGTWRESFQAVLDRAGYGKRVIGIPAGPALTLLRWLDHLGWRVGESPLGTSPLPWLQSVRATAARDSYCAVRRIDSKLGFQPRYSGRDALVRHFDRYLGHVTRQNITALPQLQALP
jgi:nucleoside-diphosphate-sugar epimerase